MAIQDKFDSAFTKSVLKKTLMGAPQRDFRPDPEKEAAARQTFFSSNNTQSSDNNVANDNNYELTKANLVTISNSFTSLQNAFNKIYAHTTNVRNLHQYEEKRLASIKRETNLENKIASGSGAVPNITNDGSSLASTAAKLDELALSVENLNDKMKNLNLSGAGSPGPDLVGGMPMGADSRTRFGRIAGRALGALGIGLDAFGRYQEGQTAGQIAAGVGGGVAGAALGAKGGAALGALGGPAAPITVPLGAFIGGTLGYFGGSAAGDTAFNALNTRAMGGGVKAGGTYLVGERGPEVLMLGGLSGKVIANGQRGGQSQSERYLTAAADRSSRAAAKVIKGQPPGPTSYSSKFAAYLSSLFGNMPNWLNRIKDWLGIDGDMGDGSRILGSGQFAAVGDLSQVSGDWKNDTEFINAVNEVAQKYNFDANDLLGLISHESARTFDPKINTNPNAAGLFQFTKRGGGFDIDAVLQMSRAEQVRLADREIFARYLPRNANAGQLYASVYLPGIARQVGFQGVLSRRGHEYYDENPSLDKDNNGVIDFNDLAQVISARRVELGLGPSPSLSSVEGRGGFVTRTGGTGAITGVFGENRGTHAHGGIDISAPAGTPVASLGAGTVTRAEFSSSYGNVVYVRQDDGNEVRYAHLRGFAPGIQLNSRVAPTQILGYVGSTGRSTGNHLHLEIRNRDGAEINPTATYNQNKWIVGGRQDFMTETTRQMYNIPAGYRYEIVTRNGREIPTIFTPSGTSFNFYGVNRPEDLSNFDSLSAQSRNEIIEYFRLRGQQ